MDFKTICDNTREVAIEAGSFIFSRMNSLSPEDITTKGKHNFVTEVDKAAEQMIIDRLKTIVPSAGFIAEER